MNEVSTLQTARTPREYRVVEDAIPVLDTARFEHMHRIASVMARSTLVPEALTHVVAEKDGWRSAEPLPYEHAIANCFLVVNQAIRWNMDPFSVAQCCSVVRGKLMHEGKLISAVLDTKLGYKLSLNWNDKSGDAFGIAVEGPPDQYGQPRVVSGTVGEWKTSGSNSPWLKPAQAKLQLAYRGTREWCRLYEPAILLGVYSPDEMDDLQEEAKTRRSRVAPPSAPLAITHADNSGSARDPRPTASVSADSAAASTASAPHTDAAAHSAVEVSDRSARDSVIADAFIARVKNVADLDFLEAAHEAFVTGEGKTLEYKGAEYSRCEEAYQVRKREIEARQNDAGAPTGGPDLLAALADTLVSDFGRAATIRDLDRLYEQDEDKVAEMSRDDRNRVQNAYEAAVARIKGAADAQKAAEAKSAAQPTASGDPSTAAEYEALLKDKIAEASDDNVLKKWWFDTSEIRQKLITDETRRKALRDRVWARLDELRGAR